MDGGKGWGSSQTPQLNPKHTDSLAKAKYDEQTLLCNLFKCMLGAFLAFRQHYSFSFWLVFPTICCAAFPSILFYQLAIWPQHPFHSAFIILILACFPPKSSSLCFQVLFLSAAVWLTRLLLAGYLLIVSPVFSLIFWLVSPTVVFYWFFKYAILTSSDFTVSESLLSILSIYLFGVKFISNSVQPLQIYCYKQARSKVTKENPDLGNPS